MRSNNCFVYFHFITAVLLVLGCSDKHRDDEYILAQVPVRYAHNFNAVIDLSDRLHVFCQVGQTNGLIVTTMPFAHYPSKDKMEIVRHDVGCLKKDDYYADFSIYEQLCYLHLVGKSKLYVFKMPSDDKIKSTQVDLPLLGDLVTHARVIRTQDGNVICFRGIVKRGDGYYLMLSAIYGESYIGSQVLPYAGGPFDISSHKSNSIVAYAIKRTAEKSEITFRQTRIKDSSIDILQEWPDLHVEGKLLHVFINAISSAPRVLVVTRFTIVEACLTTDGKWSIKDIVRETWTMADVVRYGAFACRKHMVYRPLWQEFRYLELACDRGIWEQGDIAADYAANIVDARLVSRSDGRLSWVTVEECSKNDEYFHVLYRNDYNGIMQTKRNDRDGH